MMHSSASGCSSGWHQLKADACSFSRHSLAACSVRSTAGRPAALLPHHVQCTPPTHCAAQSATRAAERGAGLATAVRSGSAQLLRQVMAPALQQEAGAVADVGAHNAKQQVLMGT